MSFGRRHKWDREDSEMKAEIRMRDACSLKATAGKTTISMQLELKAGSRDLVTLQLICT